MRRFPGRLERGGVLIGAYACRVRAEKQAEFLSCIREIVDRTRWMSGCLDCRLWADVHDPGAFSFLSEWTCREDFTRFLESAEYRVLRGMTILMAADARFSVDDVVTRTALPAPRNGQ
jgi:quinol monooxygenase YgiN